MSASQDRIRTSSARTLTGTGVPPGSHAGAGYGEPFGASERDDAWWVKPVLQALGLVVLIGYANYAAILGAAHYQFVEGGRHYLSPFYSPYVHPALAAVVALARAPHPDLPARLPRHLLLLPQGVLPLVLRGSDRVRGG